MTIDPTQLRIRAFPDPALRAKAAPVGRVDDLVRDVAARMIELMIEAEGIGLAAPQVGAPWRLFVAHVPEDAELGRSLGDSPLAATAAPVVYVNPTLDDYGGALTPYEEGCLSIPDIRGEVRRHDEVSIEATGLDGDPIKCRAQGLLARCWQHEADHLDGVLIIDRMTPMSRLKNRLAIRDLERNGSPV